MTNEDIDFHKKYQSTVYQKHHAHGSYFVEQSINHVEHGWYSVQQSMNHVHDSFDKLYFVVLSYL